MFEHAWPYPGTYVVSLATAQMGKYGRNGPTLLAQLPGQVCIFSSFLSAYLGVNSLFSFPALPQQASLATDKQLQLIYQPQLIKAAMKLNIVMSIYLFLAAIASVAAINLDPKCG